MDAERGRLAEADAGTGQEMAVVDDGGNLGENGMTDEDRAKEVGP